MAIQQLDLGAVFNALAQQRALRIQEHNAAQQGSMNALQMARYQREDDEENRVKNELAKLSDPNLSEDDQRNAFARAYPKLRAEQLFAQGKFAIGADGTIINERDGSIVRRPGVLDGEGDYTQPTTPQARPTLSTGGHGPVPMPAERQPLGVQMASSESGGRPGAVNKQGFSGKYQFGEAAATEAGFYEPDDNPTDNKWNGKFKGLAGVNSYQDFLGNEAAQDQAFGMHQTHLDAEIEGRGLSKYIGQTVGGVPITRDALAGMMHIGGPTGTQKFLESGGQYNPGDSNGTRISDYGKKFAGDQGNSVTLQANQQMAQVFGPELASKVFAAEKANPNALLSEVLPPEWMQKHPEAVGKTLAQSRQALESQLGGSQQQAGNDGWSRVKSTKSLGLQDAPSGMMWQGKKRADGTGYDTKLVPAPGTEARRLSPEEVVRRGYPKGSVVQVDAAGNETVKSPGNDQERADKQTAQSFDQETKLRTEHQNLVKGFDVAQTNYATMPELAADETGGSDIALVNAFFKTFAPDSTVMEGEFASAAKAGGVPDRIVGLIDKALTGQMLTPQQRQELTTAAGRFYNQRKSSVEGVNERYTKLAKSYPGVNADRVVISPIRDLPKYEPKPKAETKVADVTSMSNDDLLRNLGIGK